MIQRTNARLAGFMFLFYIATGIASLVVFNKATSGAEGIAATLASIAQHASLVRVTVVLTLLEAVEAVVLAVALFALTRDVDPDLAVLALAFRAGEGVINAISVARTLGLLSLATSPAATASDAAAANALGALLMKVGVGGSAAFCFAVGSALYAYLFLRARSIPVPLAWLGLLASVLWVVLQPAQLAGFIKGPVTYFAWIPMAVYEVTLALWLLTKGVAIPQPRQSLPAHA